MGQKAPAKDPFAADVPVAWRGVDLEMLVLAVWYRIDKGPWQLADTIDQVPTGAELHPCHRQRGEG
jgi:hypothetical protein